MPDGQADLVGTGDISSTAQDHLKVIWSALEWQGSPTTIKGLADRFGTTAAAASATVKRLVGQGLLVHEPYGPILLTPAGEHLALMMVRRHRLIETFLVEHLGYSWDEVHDEAETLEHAASDLMMERIDALLGHPVVDPHGDPIPTRAGVVSYPAGARRLSEATPGEHRVTRIADDSSELLSRLDSTGVGRGAVVTVVAQDGAGTIVRIGDRELVLTPEAGRSIIVVDR
ncbi:MAG: metal-dependent transcriptional regulator [Ornithinimicrobium sp.]|uniref:metal-dependent transcriptional regulator n=1 Tax=Ornithinimicrobium sp. TaxID=1977084 RepID=UPI0026E063ED|nr:metal-dependent transcriptional regulator [Ornithinimicrobium sp.]MDO5740626.1 metal-dependent transcriptional regulator [Ornithinimicrobium sp.]